MKEILKGMGLSVVGTPTLHLDASSALMVGLRGGGGGRLKHLEIKQLILQTWVDRRRLNLVKVSGSENPADVLTKIPTVAMFTRCRASLDLTA